MLVIAFTLSGLPKDVNPSDLMNRLNKSAVNLQVKTHEIIEGGRVMFDQEGS